ncbi:MAG: ABC transporter permease [Candidatus Caldarchaeales archaeon]
MGLARTLLFRAFTLTLVLVLVVFFMVIILGATGTSDKILQAMVNEEVMMLRQTLSKTIKDPEELDRVLAIRKQEFMEFYGLTKPWYVRLPDMASRIIFLDLGKARTLKTFTGGNKVSDIIMERLPNTIILVTSATVISALIGLVLGVKIATRVGGILDRVSSYFSAISYAIPTWWIGIILILLFSFLLRLFPFGGLYSIPPPTDPLLRSLDMLWHAVLPVTTLVIVLVGVWIYTTRTIVLNTAQEDFVNAARARGIPEELVRRRYIIRVAAPPILTNVILGLATSISGAILTETVFSWPGIGRLFYDAVLVMDEVVIIALTYIFTLVYVIARFILEVLYVILDPRVRY